MTGDRVESTRWSRLKAPEHQTVSQLAKLHEVSQVNRRLCRAFLPREEPRLLYHLQDPALAPAHLDAWLAWAARSRLRLARTLREDRDGILAAIRLGLPNGRLEGLNGKIRLISHRAFWIKGGVPATAALHEECFWCVCPSRFGGRWSGRAARSTGWWCRRRPPP